MCEVHGSRCLHVSRAISEPYQSAVLCERLTPNRGRSSHSLRCWLFDSRPSRITHCRNQHFHLLIAVSEPYWSFFEHPFRVDAHCIMQMTMPFGSWYIRNTVEPKQRHEARRICVIHSLSTSRDLGLGSIAHIARQTCLFRVPFSCIGKFISNLQEYLHGVTISLFAALRLLSCDWLRICHDE